VSADLHETIQAALRGHRTEARELWQRVADGRIDEALQGWLQQVAVRILEADSGKRRGDAIAAAAGLRGAVDERRFLQRMVSLWDADGGSKSSGPRGHNTRELIGTLRLVGAIDDDLTDDEARKRIDRVRKDMHLPASSGRHGRKSET
jgi:hypothetical protein